eukprot:6174544-Pleurochrysis_carterae.AAC.3
MVACISLTLRSAHLRSISCRGFGFPSWASYMSNILTIISQDCCSVAICDFISTRAIVVAHQTTDVTSSAVDDAPNLRQGA